MATETTESEEIGSFDDAVAASLAELDLASSDDDSTDLPSEELEAVEVDDQAEPEETSTDDQPEERDDDEFDFDDPSDDESETSEADVIEVQGWDTPQFEVPGQNEPVTLRQLVEGNMRDADYRKKTQELADQRRELEEKGVSQEQGVSELMTALRDSPAETVAYLAVQAGLLDENAVKGKLDKIEGVRFGTEADIEAEVNSRLETAVEDHPKVKAALASEMRRALDDQFRTIETDLGQPLSEKAKIKVLDFATQNSIVDMKVAFDALSARTGDGKSRSLKRAAPQRRKPAGDRPPPKKVAGSFDEAVDLANAEIQALAESG